MYERALLTVVVGDNCDLIDVIAKNDWSKEKNVRWERVPNDVFDKHGYYGTSESRFLLEPEGDVVIFCDADTVLVRDIDPLCDLITTTSPVIAGHMAHVPPPGDWKGVLPPSTSAEFWPSLFRLFAVKYPKKTYPYSAYAMESQPSLRVPPFFNYGFVAFSHAALSIFREEALPTLDQINAKIDTFFRCQINCTLIGHRHQMEFIRLPAGFNAANDQSLYSINRLTPELIRVIHYLRTDEINRAKIFLPEYFEQFLNVPLENEVNILLQNVARQVKDALHD